MTPEMFRSLVAEAALSPNVHNTQPTRWRRVDATTVEVLADTARLLPVGDPTGRDADASHGAAVEGFVLAAGVRGLACTVERPANGIARIRIAPGGTADPLAAVLTKRRTWRGRFAPADCSQALAGVAQAAPDVRLLADRGAVEAMARLNDEASLKGYRNKAFRAELLAWMRLSKRHPDWARDGLNAEAMDMSPVEALGAGVVLSPGVFEALDRVGLAAPLSGEADLVRSAAAVGLFHRPIDEPPFETGRRWHRVWLEMEARGLSAAPMTVLADDPDAAAAVGRLSAPPAGWRLVTAFRIGKAAGSNPAPARLPVDELIV